MFKMSFAGVLLIPLNFKDYSLIKHCRDLVVVGILAVKLYARAFGWLQKLRSRSLLLRV